MAEQKKVRTVSRFKEESKKINELTKGLKSLGFDVNQYSLGGVGILQLTLKGAPNGVKVTIVNEEHSSKVTLSTLNAAGFHPVSCRIPEEFDHEIPAGFSHFYEHCMFHKVKIKDKYYDSTSIMSYASDRHIELNANTGAHDINSLVTFLPKEGYNNAFDGVFRAALTGHKQAYKDQTKAAIELLTSLNFKHEMVDELIDRERKIVKSELQMYTADANYRLYKYINTEYAYNIYNELGKCPEDIDKITVEDMRIYNNLFTSGQLLQSINIGINLFTYSNEYILDLVSQFVNAVEDIIGEERMRNRTDLCTYDNILKPIATTGRDLKRRVKHMILDSPGKENLTKTPMMLIRVPKYVNEHLTSTEIDILEWFVQLFLIGDLDRPVSKGFRETLGRTYVVYALRRLVGRPCNPLKDQECIGWLFNYTLNEDEINRDGDQVYITPSTTTKVAKEVHKIMNNITVTEEEFKRGLADCHASKVSGEVKSALAGFTSFITPSQTWSADIEAMQESTNNNLKFITYDIFCDMLEHIKSKWMATLFSAKENQ